MHTLIHPEAEKCSEWWIFVKWVVDLFVTIRKITVVHFYLNWSSTHKVRNKYKLVKSGLTEILVASRI